MSTQKVKTYLDDAKFKLTAKPIEQGARPPTLQLGTYLNNPQLIVYPNHDNGSGCTWIPAGMDINTFGLLLEAIRRLATVEPNGQQFEFENKRDIPKEKRTDPKIRMQVVSKTQVGRDDEGCIWISVLDNIKPNAPRIRFYFGVNYYHSMRAKHGYGRGEISQMQALAWVTNAYTFVTGILLDNPNLEAEQAAIRANFGGGGRSGGGSKSSGGGNRTYQNNSRGSSNSSNSGSSAATTDSGFGGDWDNFDDDD